MNKGNIQTLIKIAMSLDEQGLYEDADMLDSIISEAANFPPGWQSSYEFPEETINVQRPQKTTYTFPPQTIVGNPARWRQLDGLRKMLGLQPGKGFDVGLARALRKLNQKYPGVWVPGAKQKISQIMANVQQAQQKEKEFEYAQRQPTSEVAGQKPREDYQAHSVYPKMDELFPTREVPPNVDLGPKKEYFPQ